MSGGVITWETELVMLIKKRYDWGYMRLKWMVCVCVCVCDMTVCVLFSSNTKVEQLSFGWGLLVAACPMQHAMQHFAGPHHAILT